MKSKKAAQFLSVLLAICMVLVVLPIQAAAADDEGNNQIGQAAEWVYTPNTQTNLVASAGAPHVSASADTRSSIGGASDTVRVHVTATDKATGNEVDVEGAVVNLYVGGDYIRSSEPTNSNGYTNVSLAGLSTEQRLNATVSASKVVARGKAIDGTARDKLFNHFPKDDSGDYYRYTLELHSETIDENGNWIGTEIPVGKESGKTDIVFAIDATGSMEDEINNVKNNIANFSKSLDERGLDIRFAVIEYRDITEDEETIVHKVSGSQWFSNSDDVVETLTAINVDGGGDAPETLIDALGYIADNNLMHWRSDADRFAFVLTDADYKVDNNYGYTSLEDITKKLNDMHIVTSVITDSENRSVYSGLFEGTGGIYANIYSSSFDDEMLNLANSVVETVVRDVELELHEPRMLVNMSVCYFADDKTSKSESYRDSLKKTLSEYAHRLAETTDGHVILDNVLLFSTDSKVNFYDTNNIASMADIRIETEVVVDNFNVPIGSNADANGFYTDETAAASNSSFSVSNNLVGRQAFKRIQLSGTTYSWNFDFIDDVWQYSATIMHESGHYILGFFDEYMDGNSVTWTTAYKPYPNYNQTKNHFGIMDGYHYDKDIEMSRTNTEYAYLSSGGIRTYQFNSFEESCEDTLADFLTTGTNVLFRNSFIDEKGITHRYSYYSLPTNGIFSKDGDFNRYKITYTKVPGTKDRTASYSYAGLGEGDFIYIPASSSGEGGGTRSINGAGPLSGSVNAASGAETSDALANVSWANDSETVSLTITPVDGYTYSVEMRESGEAFSAVDLIDSSDVLTANLPITKGGLAEVRIIAEKAGETKYNTYYVDRSVDTDVGYMYSSADNGTMAYVMADEMNSYTFVADNTKYTNGDYRSVSQATHIISDSGKTIDSGEIYSVAAYLAEIDYTTLSWFKFANGSWKKLDTDYSEEENMNIGARADLDGAGMYVLMAKPAPVGGAEPTKDLHVVPFDPENDLDATATLAFTDPNTTSKFYNVYYSDKSFTDKNADGVIVRSFYADFGTELTLNLIERNRTVYAAVEIVLEDGSRSPLSEVILVSGEADSDGDGLPDWYCDKYLLWDEGDTSKPVAERDPDGDGLTNLEEYKGSSDPTNPNDPVHTTNIPVASISVTPDAVEIAVGKTKEVTATVLPESATNKKVQWSSEDEQVATVSETGIILAKALGTTTVYAVTADGGYSAAVKVTVVSGVSGPGGSGTVPPAPSAYPTTITKPEHGTVKASPVWAVTGEKVTLTVTPDDGYVLNSLVVTDNSGKIVAISDNGDGTYSFTMPQGGVTVNATFTLKPCDGGDDCPSRNYTDVDHTAWYHEGVDYAVANKLMGGKADGIFDPKGITTRAEMVTILYRLDSESTVTKDVKFDDVPGGQWYSDAINWAAANEIVGGYGNGKFGPDDTITREQMAAILYRYASYKGYDMTKLADLTGYTDADTVSDWAVTAMRWAVAEGIINGTSTTTLSPSGDSTRAQVATIFMRFSDNIVK